MGSLDAEMLSSLLLLPDGMAIEAVYPTQTHLTVQVTCMYKSACCPLCQHSSERIHGRYSRTVADMPCGGRRVTLALTVRKFVCRTPDCPRQIFTERLPALVQSYARMTNRLREALEALGFTTCAEAAECLAPKLGMAVTAPTLLRYMRVVSLALPQKVRILGIDDWAWKKGQTYGTILVDLELHRPIELLPDREASTVAAWLRGHPEVEIVSRDRGGEYAAAARKGAPQAQQVADRFHLVKNLRETLKDLMERKQSCLPEAEEHASDAIPDRAQGRARGIKYLEVKPETEQGKRYRIMSAYPRQSAQDMTSAALRTQVRRDKRSARYEAVRTLHQQGFGIREIARRLKICRATVRRFVSADTFPEKSKLPQRRSLLDPYRPYILTRWQEGCWNSVQLYDELKARGYPASAPLLRRFLAELRKKQREAGDPTMLPLDATGTTVEVPAGLPPQPDITARMSATRASWLFVSQAGKLDEKQTQHVEQIRAAHPDLESAYQLSQEFVMMLAERRAADLESWLTQAEHSGLPEFKKMVKGIRQDYAAVKAAFSSMWSNGQVEAQVNCLKLQKRIVFGRANF